MYLTDSEHREILHPVPAPLFLSALKSLINGSMSPPLQRSRTGAPSRLIDELDVVSLPYPWFSSQPYALSFSVDQVSFCKPATFDISWAGSHSFTYPDNLHGHLFHHCLPAAYHSLSVSVISYLASPSCPAVTSVFLLLQSPDAPLLPRRPWFLSSHYLCVCIS